LQYQDKEFSIESAILKGRPLPEWYLDEPVLNPGEDFYIKGFYELGTCRTMGMSAGPIPWRDIIAYSNFNNFDKELTNHFTRIIMGMDTSYLKYLDSKPT